MECAALLVKLNLKLRCQGQNYVIIVTRTYLLWEYNSPKHIGRSCLPK